MQHFPMSERWLSPRVPDDEVPTKLRKVERNDVCDSDRASPSASSAETPAPGEHLQLITVFDTFHVKACLKKQRKKLRHRTLLENNSSKNSEYLQIQ